MTWPEVNPGEMVTQITILQASTESDISGAVTGVWTPFLVADAKVSPLRGDDMIRSGQDTTRLFLIVTIVYQSGILPNMRVQTRNGTYIIQSIANPGELDVRLDLLCLALGANQ